MCGDLLKRFRNQVFWCIKSSDLEGSRIRCDQNTKLVPLLGVRTLLGLGKSKGHSQDYVELLLWASQPFLLIWVSFFAVGLGWPHPPRPRVENFLETHPSPLFTPCELIGHLRDGHMPPSHQAAGQSTSAGVTGDATNTERQDLHSKLLTTTPIPLYWPKQVTDQPGVNRGGIYLTL